MTEKTDSIVMGIVALALLLMIIVFFFSVLGE